MSVTAAIRKMLAAGLTVEQALIASEAFEAETPKDSQAERRREIDRLRKQNDWQALRLATFQRDGYLCVYCGTDVRYAPQCDHIYPISRGGRNELENLATACKSCNSQKGFRTPEEWRQ